MSVYPLRLARNEVTNYIRRRYVQVIVEKVPKSSIPDIDKKKFLVPADLSGKTVHILLTTYVHVAFSSNRTALFYRPFLFISVSGS